MAASAFISPSASERSLTATVRFPEAISWARAMGVEKLALSVYPHNDRAMALYRKFGFREEGRLTGHSKKRIGYLDEIVMGLWLAGPPTQDPGV